MALAPAARTPRARAPATATAVAVALGGLGAFAGLVALQHGWRGDDLPPADHFVSEYALGPSGWVQVVAFLGWAVSLAAAAWLARGSDRRIARAVVVAALAAAALGAVATAAFQTETVGGQLPPGETKSTAGQLHDLGSAFIFFGLLVAAVASVRTVRRRSYRLTVLGLAVGLFLVPGVLIALEYDAPGWGQRGFIAIGCLWQLAFVLRQPSSRES